MENLTTTLLLIIKDDRILLARKKRGFGEGKLNGVGGKQEIGETIEETMIRETQEEIGVVPKDFFKMAIIDFDEYVKGKRTNVSMHIFLAKDFDGEISESDEMNPEWHDLKNIPFNQMFADDNFWLPEILKGNKVIGNFVYDEDFNILSKYLKIFETL